MLDFDGTLISGNNFDSTLNKVNNFDGTLVRVNLVLYVIKIQHESAHVPFWLLQKRHPPFVALT